MKIHTKQTLADANIPHPDEGWVVVEGPLDRPSKLLSTYVIRLRGLPQEWGHTKWSGSNDDTYAVKLDTEVARANGLTWEHYRQQVDDDPAWQLVSEVGWPKEEDYPVWVWQEGLHVAYSLGATSGEECPCTIHAGGINHYAYDNDKTITHWTRADPIVAPKPPVTVKQPATAPDSFTEEELREALEIVKARREASDE